MDIIYKLENTSSKGNMSTPNMATMKKIKKQKITNVGEDVEKLEPSHTFGGNGSWHFLKKLKIQLPYDPVIHY